MQIQSEKPSNRLTVQERVVQTDRDGKRDMRETKRSRRTERYGVEGERSTLRGGREHRGEERGRRETEGGGIKTSFESWGLGIF